MNNYPPHLPRLFQTIFSLPSPLWLIPGVALVFAACSAPKQPETQRYVTRGLDASDAAVASPPGSGASSSAAAATADPSRPVATLDGQPLSMAELAPALAEASGGLILEELVLDRLLERDAARAGILITSEMIRAEQQRLLETFTDTAIAQDENEAARLLHRIRQARGLGDRRYAALLRRNAMLRALVASQITITQASIEHARALRFGPRYRVRLITLATARDATEALERLSAGESFSALAAQVSTDVSAARGGVIDAISPADPDYPSAIRTALRTLKPGEPSIPIALDDSYAILLLDEVVAPASPHDAALAEEQLLRDVRLQQERLMMNQHARQLLSAAKVTVLDRSLDWSWTQRNASPNR